MPLRVKWAELLRYMRIAIFVALFVFLSALTGWSVTGKDFSKVFYFGAIITSIPLILLIIVYIVIKALEKKAMIERLQWMITQIDSPKNNEKLEELRLTVIHYQPELEEKTCSICGLAILEKAPIIQCLICEKVFHKKHFIKWLIENETCPICKNLILPFD